jgi:beta-galactosidase GanA
MLLKRRSLIQLSIIVVTLVYCTASYEALAQGKEGSSTNTPHLEKRGSAKQLIVNGKPFLVLAGELHNSSSTSMNYMQPIWKRLSTINMNTVLASVSWELTEPEEGKFDFSLVDGLIRDARKNNMHLILLWFGSWKNALSHYAPEWVKRDYKRFPRMRITGDRPVESLSPFSAANMQADAKAFAALMKHVKEIDGKQNTVIMIQVENEVGLLGDTRDRGELAEKAFNEQVPKELMTHLTTNKERLLPELAQGVGNEWLPNQWVMEAGIWKYTSG